MILNNANQTEGFKPGQMRRPNYIVDHNSDMIEDSKETDHLTGSAGTTERFRARNLRN